MLSIHIASPGCQCHECCEVRTLYMTLLKVGDFLTNEIQLFEVLRPKLYIVDMLDVKNGYEEEFEYPVVAKMRPVVPDAIAA